MAAMHDLGPRVTPLSADDPASRNPMLDQLVQSLGYRPHALLTMARRPGLLPAVLDMVKSAVWSEGAVAVPLRLLLGCEASRGAGCGYTATHLVHAAHHAGIGWNKLAALPDYGRSGLFTAQEKAALGIATAGSTLPMGDDGAAFDDAKRAFGDDALVEIVACVSAFGWFNRWNSLMRTALEPVPAEALGHVPWLSTMFAQRDSACSPD